MESLFQPTLNKIRSAEEEEGSDLHGTVYVERRVDKEKINRRDRVMK